MMILNRRVTASALAALLASAGMLMTAGCGGPSAEQELERTPGNKVVQEAVGNTLAAPQFSFQGELDAPSSGQLGISFKEKNGACEDQYGVINLAGALTQGTTTVIVDKATVWLRFDDAYYQAHYSPPAAEQKIRGLKGRWLRYSAASPALQPDVQLCNLRQQWRHWLDGLAKVKGKTAIYGGQRVYQLSNGPETFDVTLDKTPRLVHVEMATWGGRTILRKNNA